MIGLIFCAGLGTRLGELTKHKAKAMVEVAGVPCLEMIVETFKEVGVEKIIVNTHWCPLSIMDYFGDELLYTFEPTLLGEQVTLKRLKKWTEDEYVLVANGDTLTDCNLNFLINVARETQTNTRLVDKGVYAGYMVLAPNSKKFIDIEVDDFWIDIGTPEGLKKANKHYKLLQKYERTFND